MGAMKVYAVSTGSYSDYSVRAIFVDKAIAEAHSADLSEGNEVEEYELIEREPIQLTIYAMSNDTYRGPDVVHEWTYLAWDYDRASYERANVSTYGRGRIRVHGWDREAVRKAYRDRESAAAAQEAGIS